MEKEESGKGTVGVVLLNLGGPDSLNAVSPFLYNLFSDREIIKLGPLFLQKPLARLISIIRSAKARKMYELIGGKSPINDITRAQAEALEMSLNSSPVTRNSSLVFKVYMGMRYWHPFIKDVVRQVFDDGIRRLIVLSLYPHYSKATTGSAISAFKRAVEVCGIEETEYSVQYIDKWYDYPPYIDAFAEVVYQRIKELGWDNFRLLYSAHGLPKSMIRGGDPYLEHIKTTIGLINKRLSEEPYNISSLNWSLSFQSKTGPVEWLDPSTGEAIENFAGEGVRNLLVIPISFVSDHVETLYEVDILFKELAEKQGIDLKRCSSFNASAGFIAVLKGLVIQSLKI